MGGWCCKQICFKLQINQEVVLQYDSKKKTLPKTQNHPPNITQNLNHPQFYPDYYHPQQYVPQDYSQTHINQPRNNYGVAQGAQYYGRNPYYSENQNPQNAQNMRPQQLIRHIILNNNMQVYLITNNENSQNLEVQYNADRQRRGGQVPEQSQIQQSSEQGSQPSEVQQQENMASQQEQEYQSNPSEYQSNPSEYQSNPSQQQNSRSIHDSEISILYPSNISINNLVSRVNIQLSQTSQ